MCIQEMTAFGLTPHLLCKSYTFTLKTFFGSDCVLCLPSQDDIVAQLCSCILLLACQPIGDQVHIAGKTSANISDTMLNSIKFRKGRKIF